MAEPSPPSFTALLDFLLREVPTSPGGSARFTIEDTVRAVARVVEGGGEERAMAVAGAWLETARRVGPSPAADRPALEALASLFRVPPECFVDRAASDAVRARVEVAREANQRGLRISGPCRTGHMTSAAFFALCQQLVQRTAAAGAS